MKFKFSSEAISKRLKISKAQQTMFLAVAATSVMVGIAAVFIIYFSKYISLNSKVIDAKDSSILTYSMAVKESGACRAPKNGKTYTVDELKKCSPNDINAEDVEGTLRHNILIKMASNEALESIARTGLSVCTKSSGLKYSYDELLKLYQDAESDDKRSYYMNAIKICSALRVVPDALPVSKNEEALLASLNQIFLLSGWLPQSLSPSSASASQDENGLNIIPVSLIVEAGDSKTLEVLSNINKSIREFSVTTATIEWASGGQLNVKANANAYYVSPVETSESMTTVRANSSTKKGTK